MQSWWPMDQEYDEDPSIFTVSIKISKLKLITNEKYLSEFIYIEMYNKRSL